MPWALTYDSHISIVPGISDFYFPIILSKIKNQINSIRIDIFVSHKNAEKVRWLKFNKNTHCVFYVIIKCTTSTQKIVYLRHMYYV